MTSVALVPGAVDSLVMIMLHFLFSINCTVFHIPVFGFHSWSHRINRDPRVEGNRVWMAIFQTFSNGYKEHSVVLASPLSIWLGFL